MQARAPRENAGANTLRKNTGAVAAGKCRCERRIADNASLATSSANAPEAMQGGRRIIDSADINCSLPDSRGRPGPPPSPINSQNVCRGCGCLEWWSLDWNESSISFYKSFGTETMSDRTVYRLAGETLDKLAKE